MPHFGAPSTALPMRVNWWPFAGAAPRSEVVVEMDRVAADLVGPYRHDAAAGVEAGVINRAVAGTPELAECHVAQVYIGMREKHGVAAGAFGILRPHDHVAAEIPDVRQKSNPAGRVPGAPVVVAQRRGERDLRTGNRRDLHLLGLRLVPATALGGAQLPGVGYNDVVAGPPTRDRLLDFQHLVPGERLAPQPDECRRPGRTVHRHPPQTDEAGAHLRRVPGGVERQVRNDDLGRRARRNGRAGVADLEMSPLVHRERADLHPRVGVGGEYQSALDFDAVEPNIAERVIGDVVPRCDRDPVVCRGRLAGRPGPGIGPRAALRAGNRGIAAEKGYAARHAADRRRVRIWLRGCAEQAGPKRQAGQQRQQTQSASGTAEIFTHWPSPPASQMLCESKVTSTARCAWNSNTWPRSSA